MIRVLLVDDELPARLRLAQLLSRYEDIEVAGQAQDGEEALQRAEELRPDVLFLDIQMPGCSGIEVAARLKPPRPHVVFCTAFDEHALDAFELHAVDYVLKPVSRRRLGTTIDRLRSSLGERLRWQEERRSAGSVQNRLMTPASPGLKTVDLHAFVHPAHEVSGDYYDFIPLDKHRIGIALGDVSGKGMPAGLLMASLQGRLQSEAPRCGDQPAALLQSLNASLWRSTDQSMYATFFYGVYDDSRRLLTSVNAGHPPPLTVSGDGSVRRLSAGGLPIGLFPNSRYEEEVSALPRGDVLVLYSDGIREAADGRGEEFGEERILEAIRAHRVGTARQIAESLLNEVEAFAPGEPSDDRTIVVAKGV